MCGTKSRGRQRPNTETAWIITEQKESLNNELIRTTDDREGWRAMIADECNRPVT